MRCTCIASRARMTRTRGTRTVVASRNQQTDDIARVANELGALTAIQDTPNVEPRRSERLRRCPGNRGVPGTVSEAVIGPAQWLWGFQAGLRVVRRP